MTVFQMKWNAYSGCGHAFWLEGFSNEEWSNPDREISFMLIKVIFIKIICIGSFDVCYYIKLCSFSKYVWKIVFFKDIHSFCCLLWGAGLSFCNLYECYRTKHNFSKISHFILVMQFYMPYGFWTILSMNNSSRAFY